MAVYRFSALSDGRSISFNPAADVLQFDQTTISAADIRFTTSNGNTRIEVVGATSAGKDVTLLNTSPLQISTFNVTFANGSRLLIGDTTSGTASDNSANNLVGTSGRDHLAGLGGNDTLNGGAGLDYMDGGSGNDTYIVTAGDVLVDASGVDHVMSSGSWTLASGFENLTLTGTANLQGIGNSAANRIVGNSGANLLRGLDGNDALDGGAGADRMEGGLGNDSYVVDNAGDVVVEADGAGVDTVRSSISYTLPAFVNNLTLTGTAAINGTGNTAANVITGNAASNVLRGLEGNDTLDGAAGADRMEGGAGDDTYIVDNTGDVVVEADGAGVDTVRSSVDYMLPNYVNNLTLTGTAIGGSGNAAANTMVGNNVANQLWGEGGNDRIFGQAGDDLINGYDGNDTIDGGAGNDEISGDILDEDGAPLTGMDDTLYGRDGDDSVYGSVGQDRLFGGTGNDRLNGGGGNDQVFGEDGNDDLGGSAGDDLLSGGAGNDRLSTGMGFDTLTGGSGADGFFSWRWDSAGDRITDFQSAMDELSLLSPDVQPNTSSAFVSNDPRFYAASGATRGHDATDRVVYDTSTGNLYYDPDGSGSARSQLVFMLDGAPTVVATDITLFN